MVDFHTAAAAISGGGHPLSLEPFFLSVDVIGPDRQPGHYKVEARLVNVITHTHTHTQTHTHEESKPPSLLELAFTASSLESGFLGGSNSCRECVDEEGSKTLKNKIVVMEQCVSSALQYRLTVSS